MTPLRCRLLGHDLHLATMRGDVAGTWTKRTFTCRRDRCDHVDIVTTNRPPVSLSTIATPPPAAHR